MAFRGERFYVDFSDDEDQDSRDGVPAFDLVADIKERRAPTAPVLPTPPKPSATPTGFPAPRIRKTSAFKKRRDVGANPPPQEQKPDVAGAVDDDEKKAIDEENKGRLASMSTGEIERERAELMSGLPSSLIERLLKRATIDDQHENKTESDWTKEKENATTTPPDPSKGKKSVSFDLPAQPTEKRNENKVQQKDKDRYIDHLPPHHPPTDLHPASETPNLHFHFPKPPPRQTPMPNLDPSSPSFLDDLQTHYFPDTPHDPSSLSWLQPSDSDPSADPTSAYHPESTATSVAPNALRFGLDGSLLAPRTSLSLPTTLGLHHHAADSEAAGYTIPELAMLSRSTIPAQRCLAWQILGRFLFRLGKEEFGEKDGVLAKGLWAVVEGVGVVEGMLTEAGESQDSTDGDAGDSAANAAKAGGIGRHASAKAWATEAVWLWRQGCGGERGLKREGIPAS